MSRAAMRNQVWQACTAIRNEHRDVRKYVEYTAILLFFKFFDDAHASLPADVKDLIPEKYRWHVLKRINARGFSGHDPEVLRRLQEFFACSMWRGSSDYGVIFEDFSFEIRHPEVLGQAMSALDRIDFAGLDFDQKGDIYEYLMSKMADAGVKGEFFTPRSVVDAIIELLDPRPGMVIWDPACGTGGFLARAYEKMKSVLDMEKGDGRSYNLALSRLRTESLFGFETEAVSARLGRMNMILHGDGHSSILELNSLDRSSYANPLIHQHGSIVSNPIPSVLARGGFDRIMANPPYGGSQAVSNVVDLFDPWIHSRRPETNFLQLMMGSLKLGGRCGVVLPEGVLFRREEAALRRYLLRHFDVQSIIGLHQGIFEFADVKACIMVFRRPASSERWKGTQEVWFGETASSAELKVVSTRSVEASALGRSVRVDFDDDAVLQPKVRLSRTGDRTPYGVRLGDLYESVKEYISLDDSVMYKQITVKMHGAGAVLRQELTGREIGTKRQRQVANGDLVFSKIDARHGAIALIPDALVGAVVTSDFPVYRAKNSKLDQELLEYYLRFGPLEEYFQGLAKGSTNRQRITIDDFENLILPVPPLAEQHVLLARLRAQYAIHREARNLADTLDTMKWLDETLFNCPDNELVGASLGELVEDASDFVEPARDPTAIWQLYSLTNRDGVKLGEKKLGADFLSGRRYKRVKANLVAYDTRRVNVGSVGVMPAADDFSLISPYRVVFRCQPNLDPLFIVYLMKAPFFLERIREAQVGSVRDELFFSAFCQIPVRIPTLVRQRIIVSEINKVIESAAGVRHVARSTEGVIRMLIGSLFEQARSRYE